MQKLFLFFYLLFALTVQAQPYDPLKVNKKAIMLYNQAQERAADENYASAAGLLQQAIEADKNYVDAWVALGSVYGALKNFKSSTASFEKAFSLDSNYTIDYKYSYSIHLAALGEFEKALAAIEEYFAKKPPKNPASFEKADKYRRSFRFAVDYKKNNSKTNYVFAPKNAGDAINTSENEYWPFLNIEGKELVFTRRIKNTNEDFYSSSIKGNEWTMAKPLAGNVNTPESEGAQKISADGEWMVFTASNRPDSYGNYDLYISYKTPLGWSVAENMGGSVNSDQWDSQPCLSPDKKDLYFASRRFGGFGGIDIYVSHLLANGRWSEPENLGATINTPGDDQCPFIHADNQTLYFTTNGWQGYGGNDLFVARKGFSGNWSKPVNLGYPINTIDDEGTIFITSDGKTAYYASDRNDTRGGLDIYSFELREDIRPVKTLWVKGIVTDKKTGKPLSATLELTELDSRQPVNRVQSDNNGSYIITLPVGKNYAFNVNHKSYLFYSDNFLMAGQSPDSIYEKNIALLPISINAGIVLNNIFFATNKFELKPESQVEMDKLVQLMTENPGLKIEIGGHTDNVGKPATNLTLSNNRAKAVANYLIAKNIVPARIIARGYGSAKPVADNNNEEGRAKNRRTEMKVLSE
jgi:outer membrane protein OmpA-like peptidoglycan-associated protein/tetratricopeptide (TPR) repeat protein